MKKNYGFWNLMLTYTGCMLGAGFVSGQELHQYFGAYGLPGIAGLGIALLVLGAMTICVVRLSLRTGDTAIDRLIISDNIPWLRNLIGFVTAFLIFETSCIMIAGIGALGTQMLGIPAWTGCILTAILVTLCAYFGFNGLVAVFSMAVPLLIIATITISGIQIFTAGWSQVHFTPSSTNPLLRGWLFSAINYASLNYYGPMAVLPPIASKIRGKHRITLAVSAGTLSLLFVAMGILTAESTSPSSILTELPMFDIATSLGAFPSVLYAVLLFLAMFGVAMSHFVASLNFIMVHFHSAERHRIQILLVMFLLTCVSSMLGFSDLIRMIYPFYGYFGAVIILLILINRIRTLRK